MSKTNASRGKPQSTTTQRPRSRVSSASPSARGYDRQRDPPCLIRVCPQQLESSDLLDRYAVIRKLYAALRAKRQRGHLGHWTYDLARHSRLLTPIARSWSTSKNNARSTWRERSNFVHHTVSWPAATASDSNFNRAACPAPSSWPDPNAGAHNSAPPSGSRAAIPTSLGILPASCCSGSAGAASAT